MKKLKFILFAVILTLTTFGTIMYTSCKKDACKGVSCQNGGTCAGGTCSCPAGYTGSRCQNYDLCYNVTCYNGGTCTGGACGCPTGYSGAHCENSTITYENDSYTTMYITIGGTTTSIPANGGVVSVVGTAGSSVHVTDIYTSGTFGDMIIWPNFDDVFPTNGDLLTEPFDVSVDYFYLEIRNNSGEYINELYVNYGTSAQTYETPSIPNDFSTYGIGYYRAYSNTYVYALNSASGDYWDWPSPYTGTGPGINIPYTSNAEVTLTAN